MATTEDSSVSGAAPDPLVTAFDAFRSRPTNVLLAIGLVFFVLGAIVLRTGVWAAILGVWGCALVLLGTILRAAVWWIRN